MRQLITIFTSFLILFIIGCSNIEDFGEILKPTLLQNPADNSNVYVDRPLFTWVCDSPTSQVHQFNLMLDEVLYAEIENIDQASAAYFYEPTADIPPGEHHWQVIAANDFQLYPSKIFTFYIDGTPVPSLIAPEDKTCVYTDTPEFSWESVDGADTYEIEIATDEGFINIVQEADELAENTYQATSLENGKYYWHVIASYSNGNSLSSPTYSFSLDYEVVIAANLDITNLNQIDNPTCDSMHSFTWDDVFVGDPNGSYNLQISDDPDFNNLIVDVTGIESSIYSMVDSLPGSGTYYYQVQAQYYYCTGDWTELQTTAVLLDPPTINEQPVNGCRYEGGSYTDISYLHDDPYKISWVGSGPEYQIQLGEDPGGTIVWEGTTTVGTAQDYSEMITTEGTYIWRVRSYDPVSGCTSPWEESNSFFVEHCCGIADTGQSTTWYAGDDGTYHEPMKLRDLGDGTAFHIEAGLMWELKTAGNYADTYDHQGAVDYCSSLASTNYAGYNDWRLPTIIELVSITSHESGLGKPIDESIFQYIADDNFYYWSSTYDELWKNHYFPAETYEKYWVLRDSTILVISENENDLLSVICVREISCDPVQNKIDPPTYADSVVTDTENELMWQVDLNSDFLEINQAFDYCETLSYAGFDDWRVPNFKEMYSTVAFQLGPPTAPPAVDQNLFPNTWVTPGGHYWTATTMYSNVDYILSIFYSTGNPSCCTPGLSFWYNRAGGMARVRCVRNMN